MNNRLLELAQEAEQSANLGNAIDIKLMMHNYALLIVKECINEVSQYHSTTIYNGFIPENSTREHHEEWAYIKGNNTGYNDAVSQIADGLRQHFGVEE